MKKLILLLASMLVTNSFAFSQGCLPGGIMFTTQAGIDNFQANHPGCNEIEGDVTITGNNITNLNGLSVVNLIGGSLAIKNCNMLADLSGLDNLEYIGADLRIERNDSITSLEGLGSLSMVEGSVYLGDLYYSTYPYTTGNFSLATLSGLNSLTTINGNLKIYENVHLLTLSGLENLDEIGGDLVIGGYDYTYGFKFGNRFLTDFTGLNNLSSVGGSLYVAGNIRLVNFNGLQNLASIGGNFGILLNDSLVSFTGLDQVASIGGNLDIRSSKSLLSFSGLDMVNSIGGDLKIGSYWAGNHLLTDLTGLNNLTSIGGALEIIDNELLTNLSGLDNIVPGSIAELKIQENDLLSACAVQSICDYLLSPNGTISIYDNAPGCNSQAEVEEACLLLSVDKPSVKDRFSVYPNPFSNSVTFEYELTKPSTVQLTIYDYLGKQLEVIEKKQAQGKQQIIWNAEGLPAGVYFVKLTTANASATHKIVLAR